MAPMSGVSDRPMRDLAVSHGAGLVVSEMVASHGLVERSRESSRRIERGNAPVHMVQLAGRESGWMGDAAAIAQGEGADIIDINMGCPAKKVIGGYSGSALMRDLDHALTLIEATVKAVSIPVTLKMRLGWDQQSINAPELARRAVDAGVRMITVHGRTRAQFYKGSANWQAIRAVRDAIPHDIPLVANGDAMTAADAARMAELAGADAVMIGRAHYGQPWIAGIIAAELAGTAHAARPAPDGSELADYVRAHHDAMLTLYGAQQGVRHARKHLGWYLDRHAPQAPAALRALLLTSDDIPVVQHAIAAAFGAGAAAERLAA
jgi:nifR3 family TIM-barrel protein